MNITNGTATPATRTLFIIKINEIKLKTRMCPAVMLANKRIINAIGFVNKPMISTGIIKGYNHHGTCGVNT
jgi:hypothetical protein